MEAYLIGTAANITSKILEYSVEPLRRQLGYLFSYGSNVNNLRSKIQDLEDTKASLQRTIDQATRRGEEITEPVTKWLADANNIYETVGEFLNDGEGQLAKTSFIVMHIAMLLHNFYVSMMMVPFPSLESLELGNLNFEGIWLETSLSQLEHLEVQDCGNMEEILVVNSDDQLAQVDLFPKLKHLKLGYRSYESESCDGRQGSRSDIHDHQSNSASAATTFFNPKVIGFPSLETLYLKEVNMERLKYLFPLAIAQCLVQLQDLEVRECRDMEEAYALFFTDCSLAQNALQKFQVVGDAD
ncbi:hypothetical protein FNV43_RR02567 [Rhamnella rubrinervis]|uniref:Disease resistance protein n=1 Tax=Rhamnella rubrinervis TaxID=2594499 RepID=A0A8K0HRP4_9ROSA|nr:hypothetical protein FNV43_RR02567 [Rhamnella rubrinervis]